MSEAKNQLVNGLAAGAGFAFGMVLAQKTMRKGQEKKTNPAGKPGRRKASRKLRKA